jgi:hypothetical protein
MLDKRLNDKGKNWRHVFKSLTVLDYILHAGSENVVQYFRCVFSSSSSLSYLGINAFPIATAKTST